MVHGGSDVFHYIIQCSIFPSKPSTLHTHQCWAPLAERWSQCTILFNGIVLERIQPPAQPSFSVTARSVSKSTKKRQENSSVTVIVRDDPSGNKWHGKSTFPDGNRQGIVPGGLNRQERSTMSVGELPSGIFPDGYSTVRDSFNFPRRTLSYQETSELSMSATNPSGILEFLRRLPNILPTVTEHLFIQF